MKKTYQFVSYVQEISKPKKQEEIVATLSLQLAYTLITQLTTSHEVWSKFLDTKFIKANDWKKKTARNDYKLWKWASCIVKGSPIPLFRPTHLEMKEPL